MRTRLAVAVAATALAAPLLTACGGNDDAGAWSTCEGYRQDVAPGSAQDVRDAEHGRNPC